MQAIAPRVAAALPARSPVRAGVLARAEQDLAPEQVAALPVQEAVDQPAAPEEVEAALGEVDLRLASSANHVGRTVALIFRVKHLTCGIRESLLSCNMGDIPQDLRAD